MARQEKAQHRSVQPATGGTSVIEHEHERVHVLIADDDPHILKLCEWYLRAAEPLSSDGLVAEIHACSSGDEAIRCATEIQANGEAVAAALVDVVMPGEHDGIETILKLWQADPRIECTIVTGAGVRVESELGGRLPASALERWDYLAKPFTEFEIVQRMRRGIHMWCVRRSESRRREENARLLARLSRNNRELESTVAERTRALDDRNAEQDRKNQELEAALRDLAAAQSQLLQQEKMACIGQLAAGVAHELNNPIGFVHSNLGTLRRYADKLNSLLELHAKRLSPDDKELNDLRKKLKIDFVLEDLPALIEESLEGTERVRKIVSDLKVFSHPAEHEAKYANINEGLESTLNIVHNEIKYKAAAVTDLGDIPPVRCLPGQINQVFMNLLVNAAHAIKESGEITIRTCRDEDDVVVTIADTGCGIPADVQARIFDPFFTTKDVGEGTGLGLSISYDIVRKHGGTIAVESEIGEGTTFTIRLPIEGSDQLKDDA